MRIFWAVILVLAVSAGVLFSSPTKAQEGVYWGYGYGYAGDVK